MIHREIVPYKGHTMSHVGHQRTSDDVQIFTRRSMFTHGHIMVLKQIYLYFKQSVVLSNQLNCSSVSQ